MRVPVPDGSVVDLVAELKRPVTIEEINAAFAAAANQGLKGLLEYTEDEIVSSDVLGNSALGDIRCQVDHGDGGLDGEGDCVVRQ